MLVAGCPYALIVPSFFAEHFECLDDYASGAVFAGLIRILKYLAFLLDRDTILQEPEIEIERDTYRSFSRGYIQMPQMMSNDLQQK